VLLQIFQSLLFVLSLVRSEIDEELKVYYSSMDFNGDRHQRTSFKDWWKSHQTDPENTPDYFIWRERKKIFV